MRSPTVEVSLTSRKNIGKYCLFYLMPTAASSDESISFLFQRGWNLALCILVPHKYDKHLECVHMCLSVSLSGGSIWEIFGRFKEILAQYIFAPKANGLASPAWNSRSVLGFSFGFNHKGPFTWRVGINVVMPLSISLWLNCIDFLINKESRSKNVLQPCWSDIVQALMLRLQTSH